MGLSKAIDKTNLLSSAINRDDMSIRGKDRNNNTWEASATTDINYSLPFKVLII